MHKKPWFKLWHCARNNSKLRCLTDSQFRTWFRLLCLVAEQSAGDGAIEQPLRIVAAEVVDGDTEKLKSACNEMGSLHLILWSISDDGNTVRITFPSFKSRQSKAPSANPERVKERVARHREKKTSAKNTKGNDRRNECNDPRNDPVTGENAPEAEAEAEERKPLCEGEKKPALPVVPPRQPNGPEAMALIQVGAERWGASNGDYVVGDLLRDYPVDWVKIAADKHWDKVGRNLKPPLLRGILQSFHRQGGPDAQPGGKASLASQPEDELEYFDAEPQCKKA